MLQNYAAGWYIGTFGAIAEFLIVQGDPHPAVSLSSAGGEIVTARGAMRIEVTDDLRPVAYEGLSQQSDSWTHGIAFCLPDPAALMDQRSVLTELGPDLAPLRTEDRVAIIFDLGLGVQHLNFCIRTSDPALLAILRQHSERNVFEDGNPAMAAIKAANPHRICVSRAGRIEVYQAIPPDSDGMRSPIGPHTHLLPHFLQAKRTHSANTPIPDGWLPVLNVTPPHPIKDRLGQRCAFDPERHRVFQKLLRAYAPAEAVAEKNRIRAAVENGQDPQTYLPAASRSARTAARVALRQMRQTHAHATCLSDWLSHIDRGPGACPADEMHP